MDNTNLKNSLDLLGKEIITELTNELISADKRASGSLLSSLKYEVLTTIDGLLLNILSNDYLNNIDKGRRPGSKRPPIKSIQPWVESKGIVFNDSKGNPLSSLSTSFMIANSISKKGIKPLNIKEKVIGSILSRKKELIQKGLKLDLEKYLKEVLFINNKTQKQ